MHAERYALISIDRGIEKKSKKKKITFVLINSLDNKKIRVSIKESLFSCSCMDFSFRC